uniref:Uncharacterized protein n=1 Tax=Arundo donax TaxID=35708 RepID=A0A0A9BVE1_ARUDO
MALYFARIYTESLQISSRYSALSIKFHLGHSL